MCHTQERQETRTQFRNPKGKRLFGDIGVARKILLMYFKRCIYCLSVYDRQPVTVKISWPR
jgi:hypothetical protein